MATEDVVKGLKVLQDELYQLITLLGIDSAFAVQKAKRWKERTAAYLREHVGEDEAKQLEGRGIDADSPRDFVSNSVEFYGKFLRALILHLDQKALHEKASANIREALSRLEIHPRVIEVSDNLFSQGNYREAILNTYIALVEAVKSKAGLRDKDNTPLMQDAFSQKQPKLRVSDDPDDQVGFMSGSTWVQSWLSEILRLIA